MVADSVSLPGADTKRLLKDAPIPLTVVTGPNPVALPVPAKVRVTGIPPVFCPLSVTETMGVGLGPVGWFARALYPEPALVNCTDWKLLWTAPRSVHGWLPEKPV